MPRGVLRSLLCGDGATAACPLVAPQSFVMTITAADLPPEGGCTCRAVRYRLASRPLFVHCCHCTWCQRESGSAFAVTAFIEASQVELLKGRLTQTTLPSGSGK